MSDLPHWVRITVLVACVACVVGLIVWARGTVHHRGEDVGAVRAPYGVTRTWGG
jgi:hypothetical protein